MLCFDLSKWHLVTNEMKVYLNVFGLLMMNQITSHVYRTNVVAEDNSGLSWTMTKLMK
jgi:hypothetical protein